MPKAFASAQEIAPSAGLKIEQPAHWLTEPSEPQPNFSRSEVGNSCPPMPRTSLSVMVVIGRERMFDAAMHTRRSASLVQSAWRVKQD